MQSMLLIISATVVSYSNLVKCFLYNTISNAKKLILKGRVVLTILIFSF
jgi:hypothetical protein